MHLKRLFWEYYQPFNKSINANDREAALKILEEMGARFPGERWKGMVLKFMDYFGELPEHIHIMMMLSPSDQNLKEYLRRKDGQENPSEEAL